MFQRESMLVLKKCFRLVSFQTIVNNHHIESFACSFDGYIKKMMDKTKKWRIFLKN
jgi:hypothetical protein